MSTMTSHTIHSERPERSRNAKAQARHRAKRKAYIEQLEQTVTKLQTALGLTHEDVTVLPPPLLRIRELEQENARLAKENDELRRMVSSDSNTRGLSMDISRRSSLSNFQDSRTVDRDCKRKKMGADVEGTYMSPNEPHPQGADPTRPPPLTIPQPMPHHYSYPPSNPHGVTTSSPMFNLHATAFQMPNTPSGSSATSSPPFSASIILINGYSVARPAQMQEPLHSPVNHRPASMQGPPSITSYATRTNHYGSVKMEDDHYAAQNGNCTLPPPTNSYAYDHTNGAMDNQWHAYSSERGHLHR